jgi:hypothetical protein
MGYHPAHQPTRLSYNYSRQGSSRTAVPLHQFQMAVFAFFNNTRSRPIADSCVGVTRGNIT